MVGGSAGSQQTPEYGKLAGEGDFVFNPPPSDPATWIEPDERDPEVKVDTLWDGKIPDKFLEEQICLDIFLKDGFGFFRQRGNLLRKRLADPRKRTRIAIVHPNFAHIEAVAGMDAAKKGDGAQQKADCVAAINELKKIATEIATESFDPRRFNTFLGYHLVPTWNGFIGDNTDVINMYFSRPYRGPLNSFTFKKGDKGFSTQLSKILT